MGSRQDAKNEKALKELLKLPENRRCFNCENLVRGYLNEPARAPGGGDHGVRVISGDVDHPPRPRRDPSTSFPTSTYLCAQHVVAFSEWWEWAPGRACPVGGGASGVAGSLTGHQQPDPLPRVPPPQPGVWAPCEGHFHVHIQDRGGGGPEAAGQRGERRRVARVWRRRRGGCG